MTLPGSWAVAIMKRVVRPKIVPWTAGQVDAIRGELPGRYRAMTDTGRYLGLRHGEIFGLPSMRSTGCTAWCM
jgi:hypothetical protein